MTKEEELLAKRIKDLAYKADRAMRPVYSDFLNLNEQNIYESLANELNFVDAYLWGGHNLSERKMVVFLPKDYLIDEYTGIIGLFDEAFDCIRISPLNKKFADKLNHRDYLGAILNTGIDRSKIGDIVVEENMAYFFCVNSLSDFICNELTRVKHTSVMATIDYDTDLSSIVAANYKLIQGSISSMRADSVVATAVKGSRSTAETIINEKKLFVNAKQVMKKDANINIGDVLSIRGYGKYIVDEVGSPNSKNRFKITLKMYQ